MPCGAAEQIQLASPRHVLTSDHGSGICAQMSVQGDHIELANGISSILRGGVNSFRRETTTSFTESTTGKRILYGTTSFGFLSRLSCRDRRQATRSSVLT